MVATVKIYNQTQKKKGGGTNIKKKKNGIHLNKMEEINNLQIIIYIEGLYKYPTGQWEYLRDKQK